MPQTLPHCDRPTASSGWRGVLLGVALAGLVALGAAAWRETHGVRPPALTAASLDQARAALERHRDDLTRCYGAVGLGVRRRSLDDAAAIVVVYLPASSAEPDIELRLGGVPVIFEITGRTAISTRRNVPGEAP